MTARFFYLFIIFHYFFVEVRLYMSLLQLDLVDLLTARKDSRLTSRNTTGDLTARERKQLQYSYDDKFFGDRATVETQSVEKKKPSSVKLFDDAHDFVPDFLSNPNSGECFIIVLMITCSNFWRVAISYIRLDKRLELGSPRQTLSHQIYREQFSTSFEQKESPTSIRTYQSVLY